MPGRETEDAVVVNKPLTLRASRTLRRLPIVLRIVKPHESIFMANF